MKHPRIISLPLALFVAAAPLVSKAATFFTDNFTNGSTLNSASPANPTTTNTAYELVASKSWSPAPSLSANDLKFGIAATGTGYIEAQALFTTNAVALTQPGDFIQLTVVFTNTSGLLTAAAGQLGVGLYNSGQVKPVAGGINNALPATSTGFAQNWLGYAAALNFTGAASRMLTRPAQAATATVSQDLVTFGTSSSYAGGTIVGSTTANATLVAGSTYTEVLTITLNDVNSLAITNTLYAGPTTSGTVVTNFGSIATNTTFLTSGFDALAIGYCSRNAAGGAPLIDVSSILVSGSVTVVSAPPDITSQPVSVVVPSGGSVPFVVVAQGFNMTYQWHRNGTNLLNGGNISGATSPTLVLSPVSAADVASGANGYYVTVTGAGNYSTNSTTNSLTLGTARNLIWGAGPAVWDLNTTASFLDPVFPTAFNYGDSVTFPNGGSPSGVTLTGNYLSASSVTVDGNYSFTGAGSFAGPGKLIYRDGTFLDLGNANTYTGGTLISNATAYVYLRNYSAFGSGPVTLAKAGGLMEVIPSGSATAGIAGDVIVQDDFTIQFNGMGTFGGVLLGNLSGAAGKVLTLNPNPSNTTTNQRIRVYGTNSTCAADVVLNSALITLAPYLGSGNQTYGGVISGAGGINQRGNGIVILSGQNTYSGGTTPAGGNIGFGASTVGVTPDSGPIGTGPLLLAPETTAATANGLVFASGGARTIANPVQHQNGTNNLTLIIGGNNDLTFSGPYTLNGNDNLLGTFSNRTVQVTNTALTTFSGVISDNGQNWGLIKTGNGILALSAAETYTGPTAVSNGTLRVNGSLATGAVVVATNATLGGTGTINGSVTVVSGGILAPGNSIGTLTMGGNLTLSGHLAIEVNRSGLSSDRINVSGNVTNLGSGTVTVTNLGAALVAGDVFTLFNKAVTNGAALTVTGASVNWTNKLAINGTIEVLAAIPTTGTNITYSVSGNTLTLSWPASYLGWSLQSNSVSLTATNWALVPGSAAVNSMNFTVNPTKPNVFYRMISP